MSDLKQYFLPDWKARGTVAAALLWAVFAFELYDLFDGDFSISLVAHTLLPNAALQQSLPPEAIETSSLLKRNKISVFRLDRALTLDGGLNQRIVEGSYPARLDEDAAFLIAVKSSNEAGACRRLDGTEHLVMYDCRRRN